MSHSVTVQIPGATSNCGPGFDTLGIALTLHNFVELQLTPGCGDIVPAQHGASELTASMVQDIASAFFSHTGLLTVGFRYDIWGEVPPARGLSSSATVRAGVLSGLNHLRGTPLSQEEMIRIVSRFEAPDGVAACFKGGFCLSRIDPESGAYVNSVRYEVPHGLAMVVVSPDAEVQTRVQREVLPDSIPFFDVVKSINSLAWIVSAFASGDYSRLQAAVTDYIHEPYRESLCPFTREAIRAGMEHGAYCGWLSGSGSSVLCVGPQAEAIEIGKAMLKVFEVNGTPARLLKLRTANTGLRILPA
ncbi:MAG: homoserine kinase [Opitutales bacterium]|nr:homoserine kinase [Opitutales bacterium]